MYERNQKQEKVLVLESRFYKICLYLVNRETDKYLIKFLQLTIWWTDNKVCYLGVVYYVSYREALKCHLGFLYVVHKYSSSHFIAGFFIH